MGATLEVVGFTKTEVLSMSDISKADWDSFLNKYTFSTVFHTQEWMKTLHEAYGHEPKCIASFNENDTLIALMPFMIDKRYGIENYFSMPFDTYGGAIGDIDDCINLENKFMDLPGVGVRYYIDYSSNDGDLVETEVLRLRDRDINTILHDVIRKTNRTAIKSAIKHNVNIIEVKKTVTNFDKVDQVLVDSIVKNMIPFGLAKIYVAEIDGGIAAVSIFFVYKNMMMYWANTTTELGRKTNANYLLLWTAIKYAKDEAYCLEFNFGASPKNADSLVKFKKSWGTETKYYVKNQRVPKLLYPFYKLREVLRG